MDTQHFYAMGPYGEEYDVFCDDGSEREHQFIGRAANKNHADAMIEFAEAGNWDMVATLHHRPTIDSEPEPHPAWLQKRFSDGAKSINTWRETFGDWDDSDE